MKDWKPVVGAKSHVRLKWLLSASEGCLSASVGDFQQLDVKLSLGSKAKQVEGEGMTSEGETTTDRGECGLGFGSQRILPDLQQAGVWFLELMLKCHNIKRNDCDRHIWADDRVYQQAALTITNWRADKVILIIKVFPPLSCGLTVRVQERPDPSRPMTRRLEEIYSECWRGSDGLTSLSNVPEECKPQSEKKPS